MSELTVTPTSKRVLRFEEFTIEDFDEPAYVRDREGYIRALCAKSEIKINNLYLGVGTSSTGRPISEGRPVIVLHGIGEDNYSTILINF